MKIAFVYDVIYPHVKGGVEKRIWEVAVRLAARGHDVHIFGMKYWDGADIVSRDGVTIHGVCPAGPLYARGRRTINRPLRYAMALLIPLAKEQFEVIDCQQFPFFPALVCKLAILAKPTRLVITWHEVWGDYWYTYLGQLGFFGKCAENLVTRITPFTIAVSGSTASRLRQISRGAKPVVISNGIDLREISRTPRSGTDSDIVFAGRLIREKHADLLVESVGKLTAEFPDLTAVIVGEGPERERIQSQIRSLHLENTVILKDFFRNHDDLIAEFKSSKIFVLPSTREGFGITALEALACGLPVVTVDHPSNAVSELIDENTGILCAANSDDLASAIRKALENHRAMREACIAAADSYDWDRITDQLEHFYREAAPAEK